MPRTTTRTLRLEIAKTIAGEASDPVPTTAAFGTGGVNTFGTPLQATPDLTSLRNQVHTSPVTSITRDEAKVTVECLVDGTATGSLGVNEVGLLNSNGDLLAYATFETEEIDTGVILPFKFIL